MNVQNVLDQFELKLIQIQYIRIRYIAHLPDRRLELFSGRDNDPKIVATKWRMDIGRDGYWKQHVSNSSALSVPRISKAVAAQKKLIRDTE